LLGPFRRSDVASRCVDKSFLSVWRRGPPQPAVGTILAPVAILGTLCESR
jgi:hypothetical protein